MNIDLENIFDECMIFKDKIKNQNLKDCCEKILLDYKEKLINKPATTGSQLLGHSYEGTHLVENYLSEYK